MWGWGIRYIKAPPNSINDGRRNKPEKGEAWVLRKEPSYHNLGKGPPIRERSYYKSSSGGKRTTILVLENPSVSNVARRVFK